MEKRYIANNLPPQTLVSAPVDLLRASLRAILEQTPPRQHYSARQSGGLFSGYTGLAYLFLRISDKYPDLQVLEHDAAFWAGQYLQGDRGHLTINKGNCGLACERLAFQAVRACVSKDLGHVVDFVSNIPMLLGPYPSGQGDPFCSELIYGRAGVLYMLRMIRRWVPDCAIIIDSPANRVADFILETDDDGRGNWEWHGKRYFGAAHGEIGIVTQLVLTIPALASELEPRVEDLLDIQMNDGNWPSSARKLREGKPAKLVQWCHGCTGFVYSLQALRPHFPRLAPRIDNAIHKAQRLVWAHGLLIKEPSLCHGIFGNAL
jgi:hypothetical protein